MSAPIGMMGNGNVGCILLPAGVLRDVDGGVFLNIKTADIIGSFSKFCSELFDEIPHFVDVPGAHRHYDITGM